MSHSRETEALLARARAVVATPYTAELIAKLTDEIDTLEAMDIANVKQLVAVDIELKQAQKRGAELEGRVDDLKVKLSTVVGGSSWFRTLRDEIREQEVTPLEKCIFELDGKLTAMSILAHADIELTPECYAVVMAAREKRETMTEIVRRQEEPTCWQTPPGGEGDTER